MSYKSNGHKPIDIILWKRQDKEFLDYMDKEIEEYRNKLMLTSLNKYKNKRNHFKEMYGMWRELKHQQLQEYKENYE